jgi:DUF1365 family protein
MALHQRAGAEKLFDATMQLARSEITPMRLALTLIRYPAMTLQVVVAIHWQALRLWLKRVPVHTHPAKRGAAATGPALPETRAHVTRLP